jgi:hypothetical protein
MVIFSYTATNELAVTYHYDRSTKKPQVPVIGRERQTQIEQLQALIMILRNVEKWVEPHPNSHYDCPASFDRLPFSAAAATAH